MPWARVKHLYTRLDYSNVDGDKTVVVVVVDDADNDDHDNDDNDDDTEDDDDDDDDISTDALTSLLIPSQRSGLGGVVLVSLADKPNTLMFTAYISGIQADKGI